jgi:hypothetical protein
MISKSSSVIHNQSCTAPSVLAFSGSNSQWHSRMTSASACSAAVSLTIALHATLAGSKRRLASCERVRKLPEYSAVSGAPLVGLSDNLTAGAARASPCAFSPGTTRKLSLDFISAKVQPEVDRKRQRKAFGLSIPELIDGTPSSVPRRSLRRRSGQWNSRERALSRGRTLW